MAQKFTTNNGSTLVIPGAYPSYKVSSNSSGLSTTGVVVLVGEAENGPGYLDDGTVWQDGYGADQAADVIAKYKSGNLVDAYLNAIDASNDPEIQGAPSRVILLKTNRGAKAAGTLLAYGGGNYAAISDKSYGKLGNLIFFQPVANVSEVVPTTGAFAFISPVGGLSSAVRINGGASQALTTASAAYPDAFVTAVNAISGLAGSGGVLRTVIPSVSGNLTLAVSGTQLTVTYTGTWNTIPTVGDSLVIDVGSVIGGSNANVGGYVVISATSNTVVAVKKSDGAKGGAVAGTITNPAAVGSTAVSTVNDFRVYSAVTVSLSASNPVAGVGKSLEIVDTALGATTPISFAAFTVSGTTPVAATWPSKSASPFAIVSGAEYQVQLKLSRKADGIEEAHIVGGDIGLQLSYVGTTCTVTINDVLLTTTPVGGSGAALSLNLKDFPTIADLAQYINAQPGYKAAPATAAVGSQPSIALDDGTFGIASTQGAYVGLVKMDAYKFAQKLNANSVLVNVVQASAGLPAPAASFVTLAGGTKGATADADVLNALIALEAVRCNFVVPLFSRDATLDVTDALTESTSSYTITAVNANVVSHCKSMSTEKRKLNRQAGLSYRGTFAAAKTAGANQNAYIAVMPFQDIRTTGASGSVKQYQPWMAAVLAVSMQAAGFNKLIVRKQVDIVGAVAPFGDFNDLSDTQVEEALLAGLLPLRRPPEGGWVWVSDQTTYTTDDNFVYNSLQAVYVANIISLTAAERFQKAFVGKSLADITAALGLAFLDALMLDFKRLKLIAASDDAPRGYKNASVKINGPVMQVAAEVKEATGLYFIPIGFNISAVQQSA